MFVVFKRKRKAKKFELEFLYYFCKSCPTETEMPNGLMVLIILSILGLENQTQPVEESLVSLPGWKGYPALGYPEFCGYGTPLTSKEKEGL